MKGKDMNAVGTYGTADHQAAHEHLDCSLSVDTILTRYPSTLPVFNRFGLDTCCGASLSVADAAHAAGVDPEVLCGALGGALVGA